MGRAHGTARRWVCQPQAERGHGYGLCPGPALRWWPDGDDGERPRTVDGLTPNQFSGPCGAPLLQTEPHKVTRLRGGAPLLPWSRADALPGFRRSTYSHRTARAIVGGAWTSSSTGAKKAPRPRAERAWRELQRPGGRSRRAATSLIRATANAIRKKCSQARQWCRTRHEDRAASSPWDKEENGGGDPGGGFSCERTRP
jgi:hypothetical protein